jgi:hypothetical protein
MSAHDMIRRGDVLTELNGWFYDPQTDKVTDTRLQDAIRALPAVQTDAAAIREAALREIAESLLSLGDNLTYIAAATEAHLHSEAYALRANVLALIDKLGKVMPDASEICTPPIITYDDEGNPSYTFNEDHSWRDVARWIAQNPADLEEMMYILVEMELENNRLLKGERVGYTVEFIGCFDE